VIGFLAGFGKAMSCTLFFSCLAAKAARYNRCRTDGGYNLCGRSSFSGSSFFFRRNQKDKIQRLPQRLGSNFSTESPEKVIAMANVGNMANLKTSCSSLYSIFGANSLYRSLAFHGFQSARLI